MVVPSVVGMTLSCAVRVACAQVDTVGTGLVRVRKDEGHEAAQVLGMEGVFGPDVLLRQDDGQPIPYDR
jgi:hypothetical protein